MLRPRAFVFAFDSQWKHAQSAEAAFLDLLGGIDDDLRPNGLCVSNQCFVQRRPYTTSSALYDKHPLMHFFLALSQSIETFPQVVVDMSRYFEDYEQREIVIGGGSPDPLNRTT